MRTFMYLLGLLLPCLSLNAQIFVDQNATGLADGTSWTDAYPDLATAISQAPANAEIWVAAGTYLPENDTTATFSLTQNLALYGGFDGTETTLTEKDPILNLTTLSGDLLGDDSAGDLSSNRSDNARSVLTVGPLITQATIIDGFTISGGHAAALPSTFGGGMYCEGSPLIRNCVFTENYAAENGGAANLDGALAANIQIESCQFLKNQAGVRGGALAFANVFTVADTARIIDCLFDQNEAGSLGGGIRLINSSLVLENSRFSNNMSGTLGGGMTAFQTLTGRKVRMKGCEFSMNTSNRGGGLLLESQGPSIDFEVDSCLFLQNQALEVAGGLYLYFDPGGSAPSFTMTRSEFKQNSASIVGGGFMVEYLSRNGQVNIDSCVFEENTAGDGQFGGGAGMYLGSLNEGASLQLTNSSFSRNASGAAGAIGVEIADNGEFFSTIENCSFTENEASGGGAAFASVAGPNSLMTQLEFSRCSFSQNERLAGAGDSYGALLLGSSVGGFEASVSRCTFDQNRNPTGSAALTFQEFASAQQESGAKLVVENSLFTGHDSSLAVLEIVKEPSNFVSAVEIELNNLTIADNDAVGIRAMDEIPVVLRNSIVSNPEFDDIETVVPSFLYSGSGNLISDTSANSLLVAGDTSEVDPLFVENGPHPYQLQSGSPAVDLGQMYPGIDIVGGDLLGNIRLQGLGVDAGAYESPFTVSIQDQFARNAALSLYPNPVIQSAQVQLDNDWYGALTLRVFTLTGQQVYQQSLSKDQAAGRWQVDLSALSSGMYQLILSHELGVAQTRFMKP